MKPVRVLEEAADDLENAKAFYDQQEPGVGDYCVRTLWGEIASLEKHHGIHKTHWGLFRMLSKKFPYGVFYRETDSEVQVIAVLDLRRAPSRLRKQVRGRSGQG